MRYRVRFEGFDTGREGLYHFEDRADLMDGPSDDVVAAFFQYANRSIFEHEHVRYELNGVMRHEGKNVVVGMGVMYLEGHKKGLPFTITVNPESVG